MKVKLLNDIKLAYGITLASETSIVRNKDGSLRIHAYKTVRDIPRSLIADFIWRTVIKLENKDTRMTFNDWHQTYHNDIQLIGYTDTSEEEISYGRFERKLLTYLFFFSKK